MRYCCLDGVPDPGQVHVQHVPPKARWQLVHEIRMRADAGVGHHDVKPAELGDALSRRLLDSLAVPHISPDRDDAAPPRLDELDSLREVGLGRWSVTEV